MASPYPSRSRSRRSNGTPLDQTRRHGILLTHDFHLPTALTRHHRYQTHHQTTRDNNIDTDTSFIIDSTPAASSSSSQRSLSPFPSDRSTDTLTPDYPSPPYFPPGAGYHPTIYPGSHPSIYPGSIPATTNPYTSDKAFHLLDIKFPIEITLSSHEHATSLSAATSSTAVDSTASGAPSGPWVRGPGFWRCFIALCIPILLSAFEGSVVSTALPTISRDLGLGPNSSWVATSFLLASIVCQPLYGQLADLYGRRGLMLLAVVIFGSGSAVAGLAGTGAVLIFGRVVQGLGSGGIDLFAELILCDIIPLQRRGHYVAIKAAVYALGTTVGPILGGVFAETNWRWCFGVNIPVCVMSLGLMWCWLQVSDGGRGEAKREGEFGELRGAGRGREFLQVDFVGIGLLTMAVVLILFALSSGGAAHRWMDPVILGTGIVGLVGVVVFAFWQRCRWCQHPIMPPYIFRNRTAAAAMAVTTIHGFLTYGFQFYLPPFFQTLLGASPTESGLFILPCSLTIVVLAALGGPLLSKFGKYKLMHIGGFVTMAIGTIACLCDHGDSTGKYWILFTLIFGIGSGIIVSTTLPAVLAELTDKDNAAATGSWAFLRGLGSLLGVAAPGAAFNGMAASMLKRESSALRQALGGGHAYEHASAKFLADLSLHDRGRAKNIFATSFMTIWAICAALSVFGILISLVERQVKLRTELDSDFGLKAKIETSEISLKGFDKV